MGTAGELGGSFWAFASYFALLGAGFMMMELAVIQRLTLFLGHPTTALAVGLFAALVSSSVGSLVAGRMTRRRWRPIAVVRAAATMATVLGGVFVAVVPLLTGRLALLRLTARGAAAVGLVFPLFFFLGVPFALGLQMVRTRVGRSMVPLAWGINGLATVVGSVGAVAIAMAWDFNGVTVVASGLYAAVVVLTRWFGPA